MTRISENLQSSLKWLNEQAIDILELVYPSTCGLCHNIADSDDRLVCKSCWDKIKGFPEPYCLECQHFIPAGLTCPVCRSQTIIVFSLGYYDDDLKKIIHDLKFDNLRPLASELGKKLAGLLEDHNVDGKMDLIIPVPLHNSLLVRRGFNQATEIAKSISRVTGIAINDDSLFQIRQTRQQARLGPKERIKNVYKAFAVEDPHGLIKNKTILLVDDVTTTGATLRENARVLRDAGAARVMAAVAATAV